MSRAVWRAAFGTLRANRQLSYYYLLETLLTAQTCGLLFRRFDLFATLVLASWIAYMWPLFLIAPSHRELLRLPLSARDAGTVLFLLRVLAPSLCVIVMMPLYAPLFTHPRVSPGDMLLLAGGVCAAFPLMSFTPFLPLPASWRARGAPERDGCDEPRLRWVAAAALWVLAPAIAVLPFVSMRLGFAEWPWVSLVLGVGLAWLVWTQRERLARAASQTTPVATRASAGGDATRWHGWSGIVPLLAPVAGTSCALGVVVGIFFTATLPPGIATAMALTFIAVSASMCAKDISGWARVLRLLPIHPARLSAIVLALLLLPTLAGCLLGAVLAQARHADGASIAHPELLCLLGLSCNVALIVPVLRSARRQAIGPLFAAAAALQIGLVLAALHFGIGLPSDGRLFVACLGLLAACLAWLTWSLKFHTLRSLAAAAVASLVCLPVFGAAPPDAAHYVPSAAAMLKRYVEEGRFSGAVLVALHGKPVLREGFGLANREWDIAVTPETEFRIGSITKQFTAAAILQLAEQGKLHLTDPIGKYYAAAPKSWDSVTLAQLLSHRSGIPSFTDMPGFADDVARRDLSPEEIIALTRDAPLHFAPGSKFEYDNSGYVLLGYVIEKQSGRTYADYLREHVFRALGMDHTGYDVSAEILPHRAAGYRRDKDTWKNASFASMSVPFAAGALYSTVDDLLIWDQALDAAKPLARASIEAMFTDHGDRYGYGYVIDEDHGHRRQWHNGGINGFAAYLARYPDDGLTVIVLANLEGAPVNEIGAQLAHLEFGEPAERVAGSTAHQGTEAAVRRIIAELAAGRVDFNRIGSDLAEKLKPQIGSTQALLEQCGALESVAFSGSSEHGWDIYVVTFANATLEWRIVLGAEGKITGLRLSPH